MSTADDIIRAALAEIGSPGSCENPMGSNSGTKYHAWYGNCQGYQWCAIYISWLFRNNPELFYGLKNYYSGAWLDVGRAHGREIGIQDIAPGDIVIWDKPVGGITDHIGLCVRVGASTFDTVEGNSGDCVKLNQNRPRIQTPSCHYYFVRPLYSQPPQPRKEDDDMSIETQGPLKEAGFFGYIGQNVGQGTNEDTYIKVCSLDSNGTARILAITDKQIKDLTVTLKTNVPIEIPGSSFGLTGPVFFHVHSEIPAFIGFDHRPKKV